MHHSLPQDTFISLVGHFETYAPLSDMTDAGKEFLGRQTHPLRACSHRLISVGNKLKRANPSDRRHLQPDCDAIPSTWIPEKAWPLGEPTKYGIKG